MAEITASMVKELREKTDAPMMECKKALAEAAGDMAKAEEILRVKLGNKASKAAARIAAELEQAADALEAGRHSGGSEGLHENRAMCDCDTSGVAGTSGNQSKGPK